MRISDWSSDVCSSDLPGCNIVAANKLYGGSINQLGQSFRKMGWESRFVDADDPAAFAAAIDENTRAIFIESLANPGGVVPDIAAIAAVAHKAGVPLTGIGRASCREGGCQYV